MKRRRFLAAVAAGVGLSGCVAATPSVERTRTPKPDRPIAEHGYPPTICEEDVPEEAGVRGIADPATAADWTGIDVPADYAGPDATRLTADSSVIGVTADGQARAYPLRVLHRLEVVNDDMGGPLLVTFCPLCNSGMVARRVVDGAPTTFRLSGLLWDPPGLAAARSEQADRVVGGSRADPDDELRLSGNLVMVDDRTGSYWSQFLARAICGPAQGTDLEIHPARTTTWGEWQEAHPDTDVLLPPPSSTAID